MNSFWRMVSNKRPKFEELGNSFSLPSGNAETPSHESRALRANWTGFGFGQTWFQICLLFIGSSILVRDSWLQKNRNSLKPVRVKKGIMLRLLGTSWKWGAGSRSAVEFVQSVPWTGGGQTAGDGPEIYIVHHREEKRNLYATVSKAWTEALPARKGRVEPDPAGAGKCLAQLSSLLAPLASPLLPSERASFSWAPQGLPSFFFHGFSLPSIAEDLWAFALPGSWLPWPGLRYDLCQFQCSVLFN